MSEFAQITGRASIVETCRRFAKFILTRPRLFLLLALPLLVVYYAGLLTNGRFDLLRPDVIGATDRSGMTFNSELEHLLRGQFDVDPNTIGGDAFVHDGKAYAYFGILAPLLRLPLFLVGGLHDTNITPLSCVVAVALGTFFKFMTAIAIGRAVRPGPLQALVLTTLVLCLAVSGAQIEFLRASIYQEVESWADALAAGFVYLAISGLLARRGFSPSALATLALLAGLELFTRVSTGLGLYVATCLLLLTLAWTRGARSASIACSVGLLAVFASLTGVINYERWGNPMVFINLYQQLDFQRTPGAAAALTTYGDFNLARIWYGALYYFLPLWAVVQPDHRFAFQDFANHSLVMVEPPPGSLIATEPLLLLLAGIGLQRFFRAARGEGPRQSEVAAISLGLFAPPFLMMTAIAFAFRYRIEFFPLLEFLAFLGFYAVSADPRRFPRLSGRSGVAILIGCGLWSVVAAHLSLFLYKVSDFGWVEAPMGWVRYFYWQLMAHGLR